MKTLTILAIICILTIWLALHLRNKHELNGYNPGIAQPHSEIKDTTTRVELSHNPWYTYYMVLGDEPTLDSVKNIGSKLYTVD